MTQQKAVGNILAPRTPPQRDADSFPSTFPLIPIDRVDLPVAMAPTCLRGEHVNGPFVPGR